MSDDDPPLRPPARPMMESASLSPPRVRFRSPPVVEDAGDAANAVDVDVDANVETTAPAMVDENAKTAAGIAVNVHSDAEKFRAVLEELAIDDLRELAARAYQLATDHRDDRIRTEMTEFVRQRQRQQVAVDHDESNTSPGENSPNTEAEGSVPDDPDTVVPAADSDADAGADADADAPIPADADAVAVAGNDDNGGDDDNDNDADDNGDGAPLDSTRDDTFDDPPLIHKSRSHDVDFVDEPLVAVRPRKIGPRKIEEEATNVSNAEIESAATVPCHETAPPQAVPPSSIPDAVVSSTNDNDEAIANKNNTSVCGADLPRADETNNSVSDDGMRDDHNESNESQSTGPNGTRMPSVGELALDEPPRNHGRSGSPARLSPPPHPVSGFSPSSTASTPTTSHSSLHARSIPGNSAADDLLSREDLQRIPDIQSNVRGGNSPKSTDEGDIPPIRPRTGMPFAPSIADNDNEDTRERNSVVSRTVLPSGAQQVTVTLKSRQQRSQREPPGPLVNTPSSSVLGDAVGSLRAPSTRQQPSTFVPPPIVEERKAIRNPYYALASYSGGQGSDEALRPRENPPPEDPSEHLRSDPTTPSDEPQRVKEDPPDTVPAPYDEVLEQRDRSWERKFVGKSACYLVFSRSTDELNIHYSESPMAYAVGVLTSPNIGVFKKAQGLSESELIGTCAANVTQDENYYYQGWCQFIKAAKSMDGTVTSLEGLGIPVDFYLYDVSGRTLRVSPHRGKAVFDTEFVDAAACVPRGCGFPATGMEGRKWVKTAKKLGAVAMFKSFGRSSRESQGETSHSSRRAFDDVSSMTGEAPVVKREASTRTVRDDEKQIQEVPALVESKEEEPSSTVDHLNESSRLPEPQEEMTPEAEPEEEPEPVVDSSTPMSLGCPEVGACYLVYNPDSSGQIVEHYSKSPVASAIGRWIPGPGKKIAGFKFKRNIGRNVLIGNCSAGVQGRKNYSSGWCQFVRSAKVMGGEVILWDPEAGRKGLRVDVCLYYNDNRQQHQTVRMKQGVAYTTDNLLAVACLPKDTPFYEDMRVDLVLWLNEGSKHGYSTKI